MSLAFGLVIARRYELQKPLGEGAMGAVWSARHTLTHKRVALKFLKGPADETLVRRFIREARAASAVRHGNVVAIHDILSLDDGQLALVMDLLEGESLARRLQRCGVLTVAEVASMMVPLLSALGAVHAAGIVHRDLKPDNIFLARNADGREEPMLLDFGVCKLKEPDTSMLTTAGRVMGTPCYMAPEQALAQKDLDARVDVWALGVILYECLTGRRPFDGDNWFQLVRLITSGRITPVAELAPQLPQQVSSLIDRMLKRDRSERLADLSEVFDTLAHFSAAPGSCSRWQAPSRFLASASVGSKAKVGLATTLARGGFVLQSALGVRARNPRALLFGGFMAVAAIGVLGGVLLGRARVPPSDAAPNPHNEIVAAATPTAGVWPIAPMAPPSHPDTLTASTLREEQTAAHDDVEHTAPEKSGPPKRATLARPLASPRPPRDSITIQDFGGRR